MGTILLWIVLGAVGIVCIIGTLKWLDRLLLRAEEKGWIFYRNKSASGTVSGGNHPFLELGRAHLRCPSRGTVSMAFFNTCPCGPNYQEAMGAGCCAAWPKDWHGSLLSAYWP